MSRYFSKRILSVVFISFFTCCFFSNVFAKAIHIKSAHVSKESIRITGITSISPKISTYIQYYVGKVYPDTISNCIYADGFNVDDNGKFIVEIPLEKLKGMGRYQIVLEQNPKRNAILPPEHWVAFRKVNGKIVFGEISSMGEISNLALTVGMEIDSVEVVVGDELPTESKIKISNVKQIGDHVVVTGISKVDLSKSTYIQYYVGKQYPGTLSCCFLSGGFQVSDDGTFEMKIPVSSLKGAGDYEIALEQNPRADTILAPEHWIAFRKTDKGIAFGDISSMGEISNLALTVGMELAQADFSVK
ncbi:hypothetical protein [uncultured Desulfobacter sp.]|uniref:hypothetical protein n=1 Tax=uncultured Desulfobacter sp. TaxID=240139 RepID=UPI0029F5C546|nr:hypothetical protein [uncultured Desulfobacter sp.]